MYIETAAASVSGMWDAAEWSYMCIFMQASRTSVVMPAMEKEEETPRNAADCAVYVYRVWTWPSVLADANEVSELIFGR